MESTFIFFASQYFCFSRRIPDFSFSPGERHLPVGPPSRFWFCREAVQNNWKWCASLCAETARNLFSDSSTITNFNKLIQFIHSKTFDASSNFQFPNCKRWRFCLKKKKKILRRIFQPTKLPDNHFRHETKVAFLPDQRVATERFACPPANHSNWVERHLATTFDTKYVSIGKRASSHSQFKVCSLI